jgi:hypothetical protein
VLAQVRRHELLEPPRQRAAEDTDRDGPRLQRRELADAARRVVERPQAAGGVLGERATRLRRQHAAPDAGEQGRAQQLLELADLLPAPGSLVDSMARECGLEACR